MLQLHICPVCSAIRGNGRSLEGREAQPHGECGGGQMHAEWTAKSNGDSVEGQGKMTMSMQGQTMNMDMSWVGERICACD